MIDVLSTIEFVDPLMPDGFNDALPGRDKEFYDYLSGVVLHAGHLEVLRVLLERGIDVDAQAGHFGSCGSRVEIVRLLLERGANTTVQGGHYGNALQAASHEGYIEIVRLLLEQSADVDA